MLTLDQIKQKQSQMEADKQMLSLPSLSGTQEDLTGKFIDAPMKEAPEVGKPGLENFMSKSIGAAPKDKVNASLKQQLMDFVMTGSTQAGSNLFKGTGNIISVMDKFNPVNLLAKKMGVEGPTVGEVFKKAGQGVGEHIESVVPLVNANARESAGGKIGTAVGGFTGDIAAQIPWLVLGDQAIGSIGKLKSASGALKFLTKSAGSTALMTAEGKDARLPSVKEVAAYGFLDLLLYGIGSKIYKSGFKGSGKESVNYYKQTGQTIGDTAQELGYVGTAKQIGDAAADTAKTTWDDLIRAAKTSKPIRPSQFDDVAEALTKQLDDLPNSPYKRKLIKEIYRIVREYKPRSVIPGDDLVAIIKEIRKGIINAPLQSGGASVLNMKQFNSLEKGLQVELKKLLPEAAQKLYPKYSVNALIRNVMRNKEVQSQVLRSQLGGGFGGSSAFLGSVMTGKDVQTIIINTILGIIGGAVAPQVVGSTAVKTVLGTLLTKGSPVFKTLIQEITEQLKAKNDELEASQTVQQSPDNRPPLEQFLTSK